MWLQLTPLEYVKSVKLTTSSGGHSCWPRKEIHRDTERLILILYEKNSSLPEVPEPAWIKQHTSGQVHM